MGLKLDDAQAIVAAALKYARLTSTPHATSKARKALRSILSPRRDFHGLSAQL